jgi:hypothetical protein
MSNIARSGDRRAGRRRGGPPSGGPHLSLLAAPAAAVLVTVGAVSRAAP